MKLIIAIVSNEDSSIVMKELVKKSISYKVIINR